MGNRIPAKILLVEDDENLGFILKDYLQLIGHEVTWKKNGKDGLDAYKKGLFNLCILDIMLPVIDGFSVAQTIREEDTDIPIIFLTAKNLPDDRVKGFKIGGDDYITKPFSSEELGLRIDVILKRIRKTEEDHPFVFKLGKFVFDYNNHLLRSEEEDKYLTKREAELLRLLCVNKDNLLKREVALKKIWGEDDYFMGRTMDVYITKLRKYLKADPNVVIANLHGAGFKLEIRTS